MAEAQRQASALGLFERWLSLWVALAIAAGLVLGNLLPEISSAWPSLNMLRSIWRSRC